MCHSGLTWMAGTNVLLGPNHKVQSKGKSKPGCASERSLCAEESQVICSGFEQPWLQSRGEEHEMETIMKASVWGVCDKSLR